jgi:hypothetical protein
MELCVFALSLQQLEQSVAQLVLPYSLVPDQQQVLA